MHAGRNIRGTVVFDPPADTPAVSVAQQTLAVSS
jgi:hypothetical protein